MSVSAAERLRGIGVDNEGMGRLANFEAIGGALSGNGSNFTVCPTTMAPNSTFWLLRSFYDQGIAEHVSIGLETLRRRTSRVRSTKA